ncbi:hypothetical protein P355_3567 [Burkholderia cenocepacia KC-01]|nr:hypothetical protein P355_3567 [Burkholderia cenocepacia KC-01]
MDDFVPNVDGSTVFFQCPIDNVDCAYDSGAKAARFGKDDAHVEISGKGAICR